MTPVRRMLPLAVILAFAAPNAAVAADPALCLRCHNAAGTIAPDLAGMPKEKILSAVEAFKSGARSHPIMRNFALSLSDADIAGLATHFSGLKAAAEAETVRPPAVR